MQSVKKLYFQNLNAIRFFAAFCVLIHHIEQFKFIFNLPSYWKSRSFIRPIGELGVVLFFVLSGFLITYLLLVEKKVTGSISIKEFYIRRILRIWPLYFLIVTLALLVFPNLSFFRVPGLSNHCNLFFKVILFVFFLPNLLSVVCGIVPFASQTWSIGTEEQFYLFWPVVFKKIKMNKFLFLFLIIVFYSGMRLFLINSPDFMFKHTLTRFWSVFNIDCMAIGGLFASIHFYDKQIILNLFYNKYVQLIFFFGTLILLFKGLHFRFFQNEIYSILFGIIILNLATNPKNIIGLENRYTNFLGKISYGIYMYHPIAIVLTIKLWMYMTIKNSLWIYPISICLTLLIAAVSYFYFERRFIEHKIKFSKIISGDNVR